MRMFALTCLHNERLVCIGRDVNITEVAEASSNNSEGVNNYTNFPLITTDRSHTKN
jgi:hypothetical protein